MKDVHLSRNFFSFNNVTPCTQYNRDFEKITFFSENFIGISYLIADSIFL